MPGPEVGRDARPMLEALRGLRVVAEPAALDGARWSGDGPVVLRSAPDEAFAIDATAVELADGHAIVVEERGWVGVRLDPDELAESVAARLDWVLPQRARHSPRDRSSGSRPSCGSRRTVARSSSSRRPMRTSWRTGSDGADERVRRPDQRVRGQPARPALGRAAPDVRRRDRGWRRPRPGDRLLPGDPPRDHRCRRPRGRLPGLGQHRPEHDDHPGQLRHPRGGPVLPAFARPVCRPRGRARCPDPVPGEGPALARPHRDGPPRRARALPAQHGLRRRDRDADAGRDQGARPADRPDRRRPLPRPRRVASRARRDRPARSRGMGLCQGAMARGSTSSSTRR